MIIGSHNSMSFIKPNSIWQRLGRFIGKCQKKTIRFQYAAGIRCFDIRIRFDKLGKPFATHGLIKYNIDIENELNWLILHAKPDNKIYLRLTLETLKEDINQEAYFILFCRNIEQNNNVLCFNGTRKFDWMQLYKFKYNPEVVQLVGSMKSWYGKIWPWLWTKLNKKMIKKEMSKLENTDKIVLLDFV